MFEYKDCKTCKNSSNCGCDDLREREYLRREGKDCYESKTNQFVKVINNESGDWQVLEINGIEWVAGHRISEHDWLGLLSEHFDCKIACDCISDADMEFRTF